MTVRDKLLELSDPELGRFNASLLPGVERILGIRIPVLRRLAREIVRGDWRGYLAEAESLYFEERMLQGLVISCARCSPEEKTGHIARFLPLVDNWAVCDCFCSRVRPEEREAAWRFIQPLFRSDREFDVRFAVVTATSNFIDTEHLETLLRLLGEIRHKGYYARMGIAWAVSVCFVKFPRRTFEWLDEGCPLDDWTYNKSLQKIGESYRVDASAKQRIRTLRRQKTRRTRISAK